MFFLCITHTPFFLELFSEQYFVYITSQVFIISSSSLLQLPFHIMAIVSCFFVYYAHCNVYSQLLAQLGSCPGSSIMYVLYNVYICY